MIGFSPYIQALRVWTSGRTTVFCFVCSSFTLTADDATCKTFRCGRLSCYADLLKQPAYLSTFQSEEENDTDSAQV